MRAHVVLLPIAALIFGLSACGSENVSLDGFESGGGDVAGDSGNGSSGTSSTSAANAKASDLRITQIAVYQTVEVMIMENGSVTQNRQAPVVPNKDAILRVFVTPSSNWQPRSIVARLKARGGGAVLPPQEVTMMVNGASSTESGGSTFNFMIDGGSITGDFTYSVELLETSSQSKGSGDSSGAVWPADGSFAPMAEKIGQKLEVVLVPVRYNADGSGRLPDVSDYQVELYRAHFETLYPASELLVSVRSPVDWNTAIEAFGSGWGELLNGMQNLRYQDRAEDHVYYYGIFSPENSFYDFCGRGCVAGLSSLVQDYRWADARASIGLGYGGVDSADTMVHEIGHAHGREHAPCGLGGQSSDSRYPNGNASLDVHGFDMRSTSLLTPSSYKDMMSYCDPLWISAYTYNALYQRMQNISYMSRIISAEDVEPEAEWATILILPDEGKVQWGYPVGSNVAPDVETRTLSLLDEEKNLVGKAEGYFMPFSHIDGGTLVVPALDSDEVAYVEYGKHSLRVDEMPKEAFAGQ